MPKRKEVAAPDGWSVIQGWTTRVSRWKPWKKVALSVVVILALLVIHTIFTVNLQKNQHEINLWKGVQQ